MKWLAILAMPLLLGVPAKAAQQSRVMPLEQVKSIMEATKDSWIAFRIYDGRQYYYVTQILSWRCGLKQLRYSENSEAPVRTWPLPECITTAAAEQYSSEDAKMHEARPTEASRTVKTLRHPAGRRRRHHIADPHIRTVRRRRSRQAAGF